MTTTPDRAEDPENPADLELLARTDNAAYVRAVHDKGLAFDLRTLSRRRMMILAGGAGVGAALGTKALWPDSAAAASCLTEIESETNGPYPADGTNGPDVRIEDGIVRSDIRSSFGTASGLAQGVPATITLTLQDLACEPLAGAAVYVWHCDRDGKYSLYSDGVTDQNYLRGIQASDDNGVVTFTSIFPACYEGRWPHVHFEVYSSLAEATSGSGTIIKTSQLALPEDVCDTVYASDGYSASITTLSHITLATDNVFSDDTAGLEMATVTGSVAEGYQIALTLAVDPDNVEASGEGTAPGGTPPTGTPTDVPTGSPTATSPTTASPTTSATASPTSTSPTATSPTTSASASPTATTPTATTTPTPSATRTRKLAKPRQRHHWWSWFWPFS